MTTISRRDLLLVAASSVTSAALYWINHKLSVFQTLCGFPAPASSKTIFDAGRPDDYRLGKVDGRWRSRHGVWIIRDLEGLYALNARSPEGDWIDWIEKDQSFRTLLGGNAYYKSGICFHGQNRCALKRVAVVLTRKGHVAVDLSRKFSRENGEWLHPDSFVKIALGSTSSEVVPIPIQATVIEYPAHHKRDILW